MLDLPEVQFSIAAVREAALLAGLIQRQLVTTALTKEDRSPVTVADFAAQALVAYRLRQRIPDAVLIGEESSAVLREDGGQELLPQIADYVKKQVPDATEERVLEWIDRGAGQPPESFWTLDPIDGTKGFLRGDQYAVALAKISSGRVEIGALGCPELPGCGDPVSQSGGTLAVAARGHRAQWTSLIEPEEWQTLAVSDRTSVADARLLRSVESAHTDTGAIGNLITALRIKAEAVPLDSQAKYAVLAAGHGDALLRLLSSSRPNYREMIWDHAAGSIIVEEAGGRVTDLDGRLLDFSHGRTLAANRGILATNGRLHDALLAGIRQIGA